MKSVIRRFGRRIVVAELLALSWSGEKSIATLVKAR